MLCDDCHKNEASIHITQISAEGRLEKNLCGESAVRYAAARDQRRYGQ